MLTIKLTEEQKNAIIEKYSEQSLDTIGEYEIFRMKTEEIELIIFENSKHDYFKCTINSEKIVEFCRDFSISEDQIAVKKEKKETPKGFVFLENQIGSDEVGFGDFFGPIIVAAAYVDRKTLELINQYGITDSKKISDEKIMDFVPKIISKISYSLIRVDNDKLNELFDKGYNLNQIKSLLHNKVLNNVYKKHPKVRNVFIDQFTSPDSYYRYITFEENNIKNITFQTKAESSFPSVALASCISRYWFLIKINEMSEKYGMKIPFGASKKVDEFAKEFTDKFGIDELRKNVKTKFKNYKNLTDSL